MAKKNNQPQQNYCHRENDYQLTRQPIILSVTYLNSTHFAKKGISYDTAGREQ